MTDVDKDKPDLAALKEIGEEVQQGLAALREASERHDKDGDPLAREEIAKLQANYEALLKQQEEERKSFEAMKGEFERAQARADSGLPGGINPKVEEERTKFAQTIRSKHAFETAEQAQKTQAVDADFATNSTSGGVMIPEVIASEILAKVLDISPLRQLVRVSPVSSPNYERLVNVRGMASGWVGEATTRSETGTPTVQRVTFTHGGLYAVPKTSNWALNDVMIDVVGWLTGELAEEFAYQEGVAITTGNGTNKPTGFLAGTPVATSDEASPARAFGVIEYKFTGAAATFANDRLGSPPGNPFDVFNNIWYCLKPRYRQNATWLMNASTRALLANFHDGDGNYLVKAGNTLGAPDTIMSRPVVEAESMASVGANAFPVAVGDFNAGYELIDIGQFGMIRDEVTEKGYTLFYTERRLGGKIVNDDAIKVIKCATS